MIIRMIDAAADELHHVAVADPGQQLARLGRPVGVAKRADAKAGDAQAMFVGIEPADRLTEHLRYAVARVRPRHYGVVDEALAAVKAHGVVRTGEDHAFDALTARGLERVVTALDVQRQHLVPRRFDRGAG